MIRLFGLIGYPLGHSWSKSFFSRKFQEEKISSVAYENFPLETLDGLSELFETHPNLAGLNVTIPYKEKVLEYIDDLDYTASEVGAVNTIKVFCEAGSVKLVGFNTDTFGFEKSLLRNQVNIPLNALVLGSGGASKAARHVLHKHNCPFLVVSRNPSGQNTISYKQITKALLESHTLVINTTPLGMFPNVNSYPDIPYSKLTANHVLFDLVYNPAETIFLQKGQQLGCKTISGIEMLEAQALESWRIWNSID